MKGGDISILETPHIKTAVVFHSKLNTENKEKQQHFPHLRA